MYTVFTLKKPYKCLEKGKSGWKFRISVKITKNELKTLKKIYNRLYIDEFFLKINDLDGIWRVFKHFLNHLESFAFDRVSFALKIEIEGLSSAFLNHLEKKSL